MADKEPIKITKVSWTDFAKDIEKNQGIPVGTLNESMNAVKKEMEKYIKDKRPTKPNEMVVIKTPICGYAMRYIDKYVQTDEKGKKFEVSESVGFTTSAPKSWSDLANEGFKLEKKLIK
jgi:hypothetical protein